MESATFLGNAPKMGIGVFRYSSATYTTFFKAGKQGFTTPIWKGQRCKKLPTAVPTAEWLKNPFADW